MRRSSEIVLDRARVREVAGVFHSLTSLETAGEDLLRAGFDRSDVDVIAPPDEVRRKLGAASAYIPAEDLADMPGVPRQPFLGDDDITNIRIVTASTLGSIAAVFTALILFLKGYSYGQIAAIGILAGLVAGGIGLAAARHIFGGAKFKGIEPTSAARGVVMWVRVRSDEQESQAREILIAHGARAVHVHETELAKTPEDLPLGSIRPDPWLGSERLGQP